MGISELLAKIDTLEIADEGGDVCRVCWNDGLTAEQIERCEARHEIRFPESFRTFLQRSDGCELFGYDLLSLSGLQWYDGLVAFHSWGNGDFDCLKLNSAGDPAPVLFMNHNPNVTVEVASSFDQWLEKMIAELQETGCVCHPGDYRFRTGAGIYSHVLDRLAGVDCELNQ